jgi:hypothetical protein
VLAAVGTDGDDLTVVVDWDDPDSSPTMESWRDIYDIGKAIFDRVKSALGPVCDVVGGGNSSGSGSNSGTTTGGTKPGTVNLTIKNTGSGAINITGPITINFNQCGR